MNFLVGGWGREGGNRDRTKKKHGLGSLGEPKSQQRTAAQRIFWWVGGGVRERGNRDKREKHGLGSLGEPKSQQRTTAKRIWF